MAAIDPGALYAQATADLQLQENQTLGKIEEQEGFLKTNVNYAESLLTGQEPKAYRSEADVAGRQGLFSSGIEANRRAELARDFATRRTGNELRLSQGLAGFKKGREEAGKTKYFGEHSAGVRRAEQENGLQAQNPTIPTTPFTPPGPSVYGGMVSTQGNVNPRPVIAPQPFTVKTGGAPRQPPLSATRYYNPTTKRWETRI